MPFQQSSVNAVSDTALLLRRFHVDVTSTHRVRILDQIADHLGGILRKATRNGRLRGPIMSHQKPGKLFGRDNLHLDLLSEKQADLLYDGRIVPAILAQTKDNSGCIEVIRQQLIILRLLSREKLQGFRLNSSSINRY